MITVLRHSNEKIRAVCQPNKLIKGTIVLTTSEPNFFSNFIPELCF